jgi:hypothetical protein
VGLRTDNDLQRWYVAAGRGRRAERWLLAIVAAFGLGAIAYGAADQIQRLTRDRGTAAGAQTAPAEQIVRRPGLLAVGTSAQSVGRASGLVAFLAAGRVVIRSRSSAPMTVSVRDGYGHPLMYWTRLTRGQGATQSLVSGRAYGFCFSQRSGGGYAASRGCGRIVVHRYFNGVRLPDGGAVKTGFRFAR